MFSFVFKRQLGLLHRPAERGEEVHGEHLAEEEEHQRREFWNLGGPCQELQRRHGLDCSAKGTNTHTHTHVHKSEPHILIYNRI